MKDDKRQKLIIGICMLFVTCISLTTVTYAWYAGTDPVFVNSMNLEMGEKSELKVEIAVEGGKRMEMNQVDGTGALIDMGLQKLINIEENKLGPGAFGRVNIYISSQSATYTGYHIKIAPKYDLVKNGDKEALELAKEHIRFYAVKNEDSYSQPITYSSLEKDADGNYVLISSDAGEGLSGQITTGGETEVVLYWYWPYEYQDVPDKKQISATNEREYDLQDTVIGNYIENIGFTFVVEGSTDEN